jgi:hypothetical protein
MKRKAKRFDTKPTYRNVCIIDYRDGSADAVIEESWYEASREGLSAATALCPITRDEVQEMKPLWHNVYPVFTLKHYQGLQPQIREVRPRDQPLHRRFASSEELHPPPRPDSLVKTTITVRGRFLIAE